MYIDLVFPVATRAITSGFGGYRIPLVREFLLGQILREFLLGQIFQIPSYSVYFGDTETKTMFIDIIFVNHPQLTHQAARPMRAAMNVRTSNFGTYPGTTIGAGYKW